MKLSFNINTVCQLLVFIFIGTVLYAQNSPNIRTRPLDTGWSFKKDDIGSGPEKPSFDDSSWRKVDLPHDWSIEDLPNQNADSIVGPFIKSSQVKHLTVLFQGARLGIEIHFK